MKEEIRMIPGTNGRYGVSNLGNVYTFINSRGNKLKEPRLKKLSVMQNGYMHVCLRVSTNENKNAYVHRLVAEVFILNPDNLSFINHKNEDRTDNRVENLEWCTAEYNSNYGTRNKKLSEKLKGRLCNDNRRKVALFSDSGDVLISFCSVKEASDYFCISQSNICNILRGKRRSKYNLHYI